MFRWTAIEMVIMQLSPQQPSHAHTHTRTPPVTLKIGLGHWNLHECMKSWRERSFTDLTAKTKKLKQQNLTFYAQSTMWNCIRLHPTDTIWFCFLSRQEKATLKMLQRQPKTGLLVTTGPAPASAVSAREPSIVVTSEHYTSKAWSHIHISKDVQLSTHTHMQGSLALCS